MSAENFVLLGSAIVSAVNACLLTRYKYFASKFIAGNMNFRIPATDVFLHFRIRFKDNSLSCNRWCPNIASNTFSG